MMELPILTIEIDGFQLSLAHIVRPWLRPLMSVYELAILGCATPEQREQLTTTIHNMVSDFDLELGVDVRIHGPDTLSDRDIHASFSAAFFGGEKNGDLDAIRQLADASLPIIPTVGVQGDFGADIPDFLQFSNGVKLADHDAEMTELAAAMLECAGLLRSSAVYL